jgi:uncharacterized protein YlxW (UPF0749 family)
MAVLREVMDHPIDPSYALAAARRARGERPGPRTAVAITLLAVLCGLFVTRAVLDLRRPEPGQATSRATLEREITRRSALADQRLAEIQRLRGRIASAAAQQLTESGDAALAARGQQLGLATGELPVTGPGLEIVLRDSAGLSNAAAVDPRAVATGSEDGRVLDRDLQVVVNGLWVAGAEAVAINGRRLSALSAIRSAGLAILVDFRPLKPPYVVQAIGDPSAMPGRFAADAAGPYLQSLRDNYGVQVAVTSATKLTLPGAGSLALRTAVPKLSPVPAGSPSGSSSGSPSSSGSISPAASGSSPSTSAASVSSPEVTP